jgi:glyoxylase-like metal-dependent hydrolase (beta-lactamase superfamily II)
MTSLTLGDYSCLCLVTGSFEMDVAALFAGAPADDLSAALNRHGLAHDRVVFVTRAYYVDTGANRVLIDPAGTWEDPYRLGAILEQAGINPASIDAVAITHGHADHYWGGVRADGRALFTNARYCMQRREWEHWLSNDNPEPNHAETFRKTLLPLEDCFTLVDDESEIVPGIRALPAFGHSPGHMVIQIGERAVYAGDLLLSPLNVEHPDWAASFDVWPEQVVASRLEFVEEFCRAGSLVLTSHFPGSGVGRVIVEGGNRRWLPEALD